MKGLLFFLCVISSAFMLAYLYVRLENYIKKTNK